jgi:hypothetical protein
VLVEADGEPQVELARGHGLRGRGQGTAGGGAAVGHVDELQARETELVDSVSAVPELSLPGSIDARLPAVGELQVAPLRARVGQGLAHRVGPHRGAAHAGVAPERVDPDADDGDVDGHGGGPNA